MPSLASLSGTLGKKKAAHLLRRATFGPTKKEIDLFADLSPKEALGILFRNIPTPQPPIHPYTGKTWIYSQPEGANRDLQVDFKGWWIAQMRKNDSSSLEKMTFFLHTHFTTIQSIVNHSNYLYFQNALFRNFAFGNIKDLSKKICLDNAMLFFLDSRFNKAGRPNENYAREFLELFTI